MLYQFVYTALENYRYPFSWAKGSNIVGVPVSILEDDGYILGDLSMGAGPAAFSGPAVEDQ